MKRFKNNKGITGIDIVVSISLIVIVLGVVITAYASYSNKSKEVKRTSTATNLAMKVIEYIEGADIAAVKDISTAGTTITANQYGLPSDFSRGYTVKVKKIESSNDILKNIAFQVEVTVTYKVQDEEKKVTLSTVKKYDDIGEAEPPTITRNIDEDGNIIYKIPYSGSDIEVIPVKMDNNKDGYVRATQNDIDWYSISSKNYPIAVEAKESDFDRNGVIQLKDSEKIYVWMPSYGKNGTEYRFCDNNGKIIKYTKDSTTQIGTYQTTENSVTGKVTGQWIEVDSELKAKTSNVNYDNLRNNIFTWE